MAYLLQSGILRIAVAIVVTALVGGGAAMLVERGENAGLQSISDAVWWAFVTLTTVGYGDRVPATFAGRVIGIGLAFAGVVMAALLTGRIASAWVERSLREGRGMTDLSKLKNHFVICGWKAALDALLRDLVAIDSSLRLEQFVLIASVAPDKVEAVRSQAELQQLHFVNGDPLEEAVLARANVA
ncbi:MAG TPA: potassium channel family protein [Acidobacteriota bacterium]|nr:potassium channel family protein [Acidobacteriota bacterium]